jgi:hypothetical protein
VLLFRIAGQNKATGASPSASQEAVGTTMPAPDISNMSPRERADRLYNRVMAAAERGDTGQVRFFVPMALQSYGLIGPLDQDAHYHVGMIDFANHDYPAALAEADSIAKTSPRHLFGSLLRIQVAGARGDTTARNRAYRAFADSYQAEMASKKPEYEEHGAVLQRTREDARRALVPKRGSDSSPAPQGERAGDSSRTQQGQRANDSSRAQS